MGVFREKIDKAREIVEDVSKMFGYIRNIKYASIKLVKFDEVYEYSKRNFIPVRPSSNYEDITITEIPQTDIRDGVYLITNFWIYEYEPYNYLVSFVYKDIIGWGGVGDVIVYGEGVYTLTETALNYISPSTLFFIFVCEKDIRIKSFQVERQVKIANIYKLNGIYVYELHNEVVKFLESFLWSEITAWLDVKERFKI
jgi:hypothetical protein